MLTFGAVELMIVAVVALIFIPADKMPEFMRSLGKGLARLRGYQRDFTRMLNQSDHMADQLKGEARQLSEKALACDKPDGMPDDKPQSQEIPKESSPGPRPLS